VLGIWAEEIDALYEGEENGVMPAAGNELGLSGRYVARELCDLIHAESAQVLATYESDFYAGRPAVTANKFGDGRAYYIASRNDERFLDDLYGSLAAQLGLLRSLNADLPHGVSAQLRTDGQRRYVFLMNFCAAPTCVELAEGVYTDLLTGKEVTGRAELGSYGVMVLAR
jgi:beta-galactosidase